MHPQIQYKIAEFKKIAVGKKTTIATGSVPELQPPDGLSMAIHSKKDAEVFMAELKAISKRAK
jgi:hypothetical protein